MPLLPYPLLPPARQPAPCEEPDPSLPLHPSVRPVCATMRQITEEMYAAIGGMQGEGRNCRRAHCHVRQVAMYVCHVVLGLSLTDIGRAFGRDRTTVSHACQVVEDRRDDAGYDAFVSAIERIAQRLVQTPEVAIRG